MRTIALILFFVISTFLLVGCNNGDSGVKELKLAHNQTLDHPVHLSLAEFGRLVEEKSNHKIEVKLYPNGQLGSEREVLELTQSGAVDVAKVSASALEGFESDYSVFSLPYLFGSYEEFEKKMNDTAITNQLFYKTEDIGIIALRCGSCRYLFSDFIYYL